MKTDNHEILWPKLPYKNWNDTLDALHMKMQVVGKIKLALSPFLNQWWNVAFEISATGLNSGPVPFMDIVFEMNFDFLKHNLHIITSSGHSEIIPLAACSVAEFYSSVMRVLSSMNIFVKINKLPSEVTDPVPCDIDERTAYDKDYVSKWWNIVLRSGMVFERFRSDFRGKSSPIHFFWGSFDLCGSRFNGRTCAPPEQGGRIMQFAENEENFTFGFWAGNKNYPHTAYYSYMYPAPKGIDTLNTGTKPYRFDTNMGEFIMDYEDVRNSGSPKDAIMQFLQSTYTESAKLAGWDIGALKNAEP